MGGRRSNTMARATCTLPSTGDLCPATDKSKSMLVERGRSNEPAEQGEAFDDEEEEANGARAEPTGNGWRELRARNTDDESKHKEIVLSVGKHEILFSF